MPKRDDTYMAKRRHAILVGAMHCFAENGFDGTTINTICEKTGLSVGALYRHFASKRDIILALPEISTLLRDEIRPETPEALWAEIIGELDDILSVDPAIFRLNAQYALECSRDPELKVIYSGLLKDREQYILDCLRGMQRCGKIRKDYDIKTGADALLFVTDGGNLRLLSGATGGERRLKNCLAREFSLMTGRDWPVESALERQKTSFSLSQSTDQNDQRKNISDTSTSHRAEASAPKETK